MHRHHCIHLFIISVLLVLIADNCSRTDRPAEPEFTETEMTKALDSLFATIFPDANAPGAVVLVMDHDSILYNRSYGKARLDVNVPMNDTTLLNAVSATKTYVTAGILKLCEQGRLNLSDTLTKFFPDYNPRVFGHITLRHVLTHTSGLPDMRPKDDAEWSNFVSTYPSAFTSGSDLALYGGDEELTAFFQTVDTLHFEPGAEFNYQDMPYLLIPKVIEAVTDTAFEDWMRKNVFEPAGLRNAQFYNPAKPHRRMAHGYVPASEVRNENIFRSDDGRWDECDYGEAPFFSTRADHGIFTSPKGFIRWISSLYGGKVISQESLDMCMAVASPTQNPEIQYGLGMYVQDVEWMPRKAFHTSVNGGFAIYEAAFPRQQLFYLIFANRPDWNRLETAQKVDSILHRYNVLTERVPN